MEFNFIAVGTITNGIFNYTDKLGMSVGIQTFPIYKDSACPVLIKGTLYYRYVPYIQVTSCTSTKLTDSFQVVLLKSSMSYIGLLKDSQSLTISRRKYKEFLVIYDDNPIILLKDKHFNFSAIVSYQLCYFNNHFVFFCKNK